MLCGIMVFFIFKEMVKFKCFMCVFFIFDMEYYKGELFVVGISNEDFCFVLRWLLYLFNGKESISNIEMFYIVYD